MKKIIGILGMIAIVATLVYKSNSVQSENMDLSSLLAMNVANAEDPDGDQCSDEDNTACYIGNGMIVYNCNEDTWYTFSDCY